MNSGLELREDVLSLVVPDMGEARRRTVLSRGYYAAFHGFLETPCGQQFCFDTKKPGRHAQFLDHLKETSSGEQLKARALLKGMYKRRISADYRLFTTVTSSHSDEHLADLKELFAFFDAVKNSQDAAESAG